MQSYQMNTVKNLLADTLCEKSSSYIMEQLFDRFPTLPELFNASELELLEIRGVGKIRARQIVSALKLARVLNIPIDTPYIIRGPQDVAKLMTPEIGFLQHEEFHIIQLNTKSHVISKERISVGTLDSTLVSPQQVFKAALKRGAASIVAVHNHPSSDPTPSEADCLLSRRLVEAGNIIGIDVLDHLVIASHSYCSMKEKGLM